jgi:hypothetical protein
MLANSEVTGSDHLAPVLTPAPWWHIFNITGVESRNADFCYGGAAALPGLNVHADDDDIILKKIRRWYGNIKRKHVLDFSMLRGYCLLLIEGE